MADGSRLFARRLLRLLPLRRRPLRRRPLRHRQLDMLGVVHVYVQPAWRGSDHGAALLQMTMSSLRDLGVAYVRSQKTEVRSQKSEAGGLRDLNIAYVLTLAASYFLLLTSHILLLTSDFLHITGAHAGRRSWQRQAARVVRAPWLHG